MVLACISLPYIKDLVKILSGFIEKKNSTNFNVINIAGNKMYTLNEVCEMTQI